MKNFYNALFFLVAHVCFSQESKIPLGTYKSDKRESENVNLLLQENNQFQVAILSGTYEVKNDSIYFHSEYDSEPIFNVAYTLSKSATKKVRLKVATEDFYYFLNNRFIGIQSTANAEVDYKSLAVFFNYNAEEVYGELKIYEVEIDTPYAMYLVKEDLSKDTDLDKYVVPRTTSEIILSRNSASDRRINLSGYYNEETKELTVGEGQKNSLKFKINSGNPVVDTRIKPSEKTIVKNWTYPGKEKDLDRYQDVFDSTAVYVDSTVPSYTFKLKIEKTLKSALSQAKAYKNRFLVIANNPLEKSAVTDFANFIKNYETEIGYYMYEKYEIEKDRFNFYNATEKDINALKKYGKFTTPSVLILNSDGALVYHYEDKINNNNYNYFNSDSSYSQLLALNEKLKLDALFTSKKTTLNEYENAFLNISKLDISYTYDDDAVVEEVIPNLEKDSTTTYVDTAAVALDYRYDSSFISRKGAYKFKTKQSQLNLKWEKILDARLLEKVFHLPTVEVIFVELDENGFNRKLFGSNDNVSSQIDLKSAKYLLKHYNSIVKTQRNDTVATYFSDYNLNYLISNVLDKCLEDNSTLSREEKITVIQLYKELVANANGSVQVSKSYLLALKKMEIQEDYLKEFQTFFNSVVKENTNLMEALNNAFELQELEDGLDWKSFKYEFANAANEAAWFVVEKVTDKNHIKDAINWSETSLKVIKNSPYYLDTLAQLYYKNGEKEKAIATEQKAIENSKAEDVDQMDTYKNILDSMQKGTY